MATPVSSYKPPSPPVQTSSLSQPAPAAANKNDGNFEKAVQGDQTAKGGGRGGISGDVGIDQFEQAKKVAESENNIGGDDLFS